MTSRRGGGVTKCVTNNTDRLRECVTRGKRGQKCENFARRHLRMAPKRRWAEKLRNCILGEIFKDIYTPVDKSYVASDYFNTSLKDYTCLTQKWEFDSDPSARAVHAWTECVLSARCDHNILPLPDGEDEEGLQASTATATQSKA